MIPAAIAAQRLMDMQEHLKALCGSLEEALCSHRPVRLIVNAEPVVLPPDKALPVGLILNELVTNALKYAFPDGPGLVQVQFGKQGNTLCLSVADDGVGCMGRVRGSAQNW